MRSIPVTARERRTQPAHIAGDAHRVIVNGWITIDLDDLCDVRDEGIRGTPYYALTLHIHGAGPMVFMGAEAEGIIAHLRRYPNLSWGWIDDDGQVIPPIDDEDEREWFAEDGDE